MEGNARPHKRKVGSRMRLSVNGRRGTKLRDPKGENAAIAVHRALGQTSKASSRPEGELSAVLAAFAADIGCDRDACEAISTWSDEQVCLFALQLDI